MLLPGDLNAQEQDILAKQEKLIDQMDMTLIAEEVPRLSEVKDDSGSKEVSGSGKASKEESLLN